MRVRSTGRRAFVAGAAIAALMMVSAPASAQLQGENLVFSPPKGFKVDYRTSRPGMDLAELVPQGESVQNWSEMVTTQIFSRVPPGMTPVSFLRGVSGQWASGCPGTRISDITESTVNNYTAAAIRMTCPLNRATGKPETTLFRAILGGKGLYVAQYAYRADATPQQIDKASRYLATVSLCDSGNTAHPCPDLSGSGFREVR